MRPATVTALLAAGLDPDTVEALLRAALLEDLGEAGDLTSLATVPAAAELEVSWVTREPGTVAGVPVLAALVELAVPDRGEFSVLTVDGATVAAGVTLATLQAPARAVLALERTSLNVLGHLCGVATATCAWVEAIAGTGAAVRDTRKTLPMMRSLQKYAVRCGGGVNHRHGLYDAVLIKDNHIAAAGGVGPALGAAFAAGHDPAAVQVEVDDLYQLDEALAGGARQILLDNFDLATLRRAVAHVRTRAPGTVLEASGRLELHRAADVAASGVDYLAVGSLTHSTSNLDVGLDVTAR